MAFKSSAVKRTGTIRPFASFFGSLGLPTFLTFFCCANVSLLRNYCSTDCFFFGFDGMKEQYG
jgi:hypothetical protein